LVVGTMRGGYLASTFKRDFMWVRISSHTTMTTSTSSFPFGNLTPTVPTNIPRHISSSQGSSTTTVTMLYCTTITIRSQEESVGSGNDTGILLTVFTVRCL